MSVLKVSFHLGAHKSINKRLTQNEYVELSHAPANTQSRQEKGGHEGHRPINYLPLRVRAGLLTASHYESPEILSSHQQNTTKDVFKN